MHKRNTTGLKTGNNGNKGGGRTPLKFRNDCEKIVTDPKVLKYWGDVVQGKGVEPIVVWDKIQKKNVTVLKPASVGTRYMVWSGFCDRWVGKAPISLDLSGTVDLDATKAKKEIASGVNTYLKGLIGA